MQAFVTFEAWTSVLHVFLIFRPFHGISEKEKEFKKTAHENVKKQPSKVAYNWPRPCEERSIENQPSHQM